MSSTCTSIEHIPSELWTEICRYLHPKDLCRLSSTCKFFQSTKALKLVWFEWCVKEYRQSVRLIQRALGGKEFQYDPKDGRNWKSIYILWKYEKITQKYSLYTDRTAELFSDIPTPDEICICEIAEESAHERFTNITSLLHGISNMQIRIQELFSNYFLVVEREKQQQITEEIITSIDLIQVEYRKCFLLIKDIHDFPQQRHCSKWTAENRMCINMEQHCIHKYKMLRQSLLVTLAQHKNKVRERVMRQIRIINPDTSSEELDDFLEGQPFPFNVGSGFGVQSSAISFVQEISNDIIKYESLWGDLMTDTSFYEWLDTDQVYEDSIEEEYWRSRLYGLPSEPPVPLRWAIKKRKKTCVVM